MNYNAFSNQTLFLFISGLHLLSLFLTPLLLITLLTFAWTSPVVVAWFGHLIFTSFQLKMTYVVTLWFSLVWVAYLTTFYFSSQEVYDYSIVTYSFFFLMVTLFYSNNIFTVIFFIEILSTLITLLLITSIFSSTYFYNNLNLVKHAYFAQSTPFALLQTLMFFFWISLVSSLNLFVFLTLFYLHFLTFDWFLLEAIFSYLLVISDLKTLLIASLTWFTFLFCIFLKCGLVPFYFWKPTFFKGIPVHALFFYIVFFYFLLFSFFIYFLIIYLNELFYFNLSINLLLLTLGLVWLVVIICESYHIKAFLAMSSILNTLIVFLAMSSYSFVDYLFLL